MATPLVSANFGDLLDPRFQEIFWETYNQLPDMLPSVYSFPANNGRDTMRWSNVGTVPDFSQFSGIVGYNSLNQGYDTIATPLQYTNGIQAERALVDDEQYNILDQKPKGLANSAFRTRQRHGAELFNNAFSASHDHYSNTEALAVCSTAHTTTSGASVASGFDNVVTSSLAATAVAAARIQMVGFRGDQAERISVVPDSLWYPPNLYEEAYEIMKASGKVDTDLNNPNVHQGQYTGHEWNYITDTNNWFMIDSTMQKGMCHWVDRIALEFAFAEDFDTFIGKWRAYMRYGNAHTDWRFILGANVS